MGNATIASLLLERGSKPHTSRTVDVSKMRRLRDSKATLDGSFNDNIDHESTATPLTIAVYEDRPPMADILVKAGARIDYPCGSDQNWYPLGQAAFCGSVKMLKWLISKGADVNSHGFENYTKRLISPLLLASKDPSWFERSDPKRGSPFFMAATGLYDYSHPSPRSKLCWATGRDDYSHPSPDSKLCWQGNEVTTSKNRDTCAQILCRHGADVNRPANDGLTPLIAATKSKRVACVRILLFNGAHTNPAQPKLRLTALHWAAFLVDLATVSALLAARAKLVSPDAQELTPFIYALEGGFRYDKSTHSDIDKIVSMFIRRLEQMDVESSSSSQLRHVDRALMEMLETLDERSIYSGNCKQYLKKLLAHGASANVISRQGEPALLIAVRKAGFTEDFFRPQYDELMNELISILLNAGASVDLTDKGGRTALVEAVR